MKAVWFAATIAWSLAGCGAGAPGAAGGATQTAGRTATLEPADAHLAALYDQACKACHAEPRAQAPLTGDRAAWAPRLAKGRDVLVRNVLTGFNAMPAGGQCFACTTQDYEALIEFMAAEAR